MKRITFVFLMGILFFATGQAQNKKEIRFEKEFQKTLALVNSDQFTMKFYIATPTVQTLFTPPGACLLYTSGCTNAASSLLC